MNREKRIRLAEYIFVFCIYAAITAIYISVVRSGSAALFTGGDRSYDAAKAYLKAAGLRGAFTVAVLEMLQMIVVCVPAEFVQVSAGLAFPAYVALPVCMAGIFLGSSIIFVIVRCLHICLEMLEKRNEKTRRLVQGINKDAPMSTIMYILFITPCIPFGAIAYFASSSKISYRRYIITCVTGVIPSILSSCILGNVMFSCIGKGRWTFITAVVVVAILMLLLLLTMAAIMQCLYFEKKLHKPNRVLYSILYFFFGLYMRLRVGMDKSRCQPLGASPALIIGAHTSFYDFFYMAMAAYPRKLNIVTNRYYFNNRLLGGLLKSIGAIPKSLFTNDLETVKSLLQAAQLGADIAFFPEGRLSTDGTAFPLVSGDEGVAKLIRRLGMPVYFFSTHGGYFAAPKWRGSIAREAVQISLRPLISQEEAKTLPVGELAERIGKAFDYDESVTQGAASRDVRGLEGILYRCPACGGEYCMSSSREALKCSSCGKVFTFDQSYTADEMSISQWYAWQKDRLIQDHDFSMEDVCQVRCYDETQRKMTPAGEGRCRLSESGLCYTGTLLGEEVRIERSPAALQALAFSCREEFEFYHKGRLLYFYPKNRGSVVKWSLIWDILAQRAQLGEASAAYLPAASK